MTGLPKAGWWKAALLGGIVSGLVGPAVGAVVEMRFAFDYIYFPSLWFWAVVASILASFARRLNLLQIPLTLTQGFRHVSYELVSLMRP